MDLLAFDLGNEFTFLAVVEPDSSSPNGIFDGAPSQANVFRNTAAGEFEIWDSNPDVALSLTDTSPVLLDIQADNTGVRELTYYKNGEFIITENGTNVAVTWTTPDIGSINDSPAYDGRIAEIIMYDDVLTSADRQKLSSYLAFKYGLTLSGGSIDYLASDGITTMWDSAAAAGYWNNIAGIGRDDLSELGQVKSASTAGGTAGITIEAVGEGTNSAPSFSDIADLEFMSWSHDGGNAELVDTGVPQGNVVTIDAMFDRTWLVQEHTAAGSAEVGSVTLSIDIANLSVPPGVASNYYLITDTDSDFTT